MVLDNGFLFDYVLGNVLRNITIMDGPSSNIEFYFIGCKIAE